MPEAHSYWSASGFARDVACPGSKVLSEGLSSKAGRDAAWGTVAHEIADELLRSPSSAISVGAEYEQDGFTIVVDDEMVQVIDTYITQARELAIGADTTWSEQRVNYSTWLGTEADEAWGTLDFSAYWAGEARLLIADLKTGRGVTVSPVQNEQLMLYAAGKLQELDAVGLDVETITLAIIQPRVFKEPQTWSLSRVELEQWLGYTAAPTVRAVEAARVEYFETDDLEAWNAQHLRAGDHCKSKFCKARATCSAYRESMSAAVFDSAPATPDEFVNLDAQPGLVGASGSDWLAASWSKLELIRDWCNQVEAECERRAHAGDPVPGTKLVLGNEGNRAWGDEAEAEKTLKSMRLRDDQMYTRKVLTPPQVEKLVEKIDKKTGQPKPVKEGQPEPLLSSRQWKKLEGLISRAPAKPVLVSASDPRDEYLVKQVAEEFDAAPLSADDII